MKTLTYIYGCAYFYTTSLIRNSILLLAVLMGAFIVHKLVSWAIWVMSL